MFLPFFNKYPHTNFEQLNIDWLLEKVGGFDERIRSNTERIETVEGRCDIIETRLDGHDVDISGLKERMDTAEGDIDSLENRMDTAEGDIDSLESRMDTAEGDIDSLESRMDTAEGNIIDIRDMITGLYDPTTPYAVGDYCIYENTLYKCVAPTTGNFDVNSWSYVTVMGEIKTFNGNIESLSDEIDSIPVVTPNPGGSGTTLNTIQIGDTVYNISGGGGSGSSVTPNPTGTPTDTLNTVDIDGTIYAIETDVEPNPTGTGTADLTKLRVGSDIYDVQHLTVDQSIDGTSNNPVSNSAVSGALEITDFLSTDATAAATLNIPTQTTTGSSVISNDTLDLTPGTWLIVGTITHFARANVNSTINIYSIITNNGVALTPYIGYENELSCYSSGNLASSRSTVCGIVKLTTNSSIKLSSVAYNLYGALSNWSSNANIAAIRIR